MGDRLAMCVQQGLNVQHRVLNEATVCANAGKRVPPVERRCNLAVPQRHRVEQLNGRSNAHANAEGSVWTSTRQIKSAGKIGMEGEPCMDINKGSESSGERGNREIQ